MGMVKIRRYPVEKDVFTKVIERATSLLYSKNEEYTKEMRETVKSLTED